MAKEYFVKEGDVDVLKDDVDKKISSPNTAKVGQILSVKAIDETGKPTAWEVIDKPGSGPGESSPYIYMTQEEYEALTEYEQDKMYWVTYPLSNRYLIWKNGEAFGLGSGELVDNNFYKISPGYVFNYDPPGGTASSSSTKIGSIKYVDMTFKVTKIPNYTFSKSNLVKINIGNNVTSIGEKAFYNCSSLTGAMIIPNRVTSIGSEAFRDCSSLSSVIIPDSVTSISAQAFLSCISLENLVIGGGIKSMGNQVFYNCSSLQNLIIKDGITTLGESIFSGCSSLSSVTIPDSVINIGVGAFKSCAITDIIIPDGVTSISNFTFGSCSKLKNVTIGSGITTIETSAFDSCYALKTITINKPSGSISGAPWGATNATVVWTG